MALFRQPVSAQGMQDPCKHPQKRSRNQRITLRTAGAQNMFKQINIDHWFDLVPGRRSAQQSDAHNFPLLTRGQTMHRQVCKYLQESGCVNKLSTREVLQNGLTHSTEQSWQRAIRETILSRSNMLGPAELCLQWLVDTEGRGGNCNDNLLHKQPIIFVCPMILMSAFNQYLFWWHGSLPKETHLCPFHCIYLGSTQKVRWFLRRSLGMDMA